MKSIINFVFKKAVIGYKKFNFKINNSIQFDNLNKLPKSQIVEEFLSQDTTWENKQYKLKIFIQGNSIQKASQLVPILMNNIANLSSKPHIKNWTSQDKRFKNNLATYLTRYITGYAAMQDVLFGWQVTPINNYMQKAHNKKTVNCCLKRVDPIIKKMFLEGNITWINTLYQDIPPVHIQPNQFNTYQQFTDFLLDLIKVPYQEIYYPQKWDSLNRLERQNRVKNFREALKRDWQKYNVFNVHTFGWKGVQTKDLPKTLQQLVRSTNTSTFPSKNKRVEKINKSSFSFEKAPPENYSIDTKPLNNLFTNNNYFTVEQIEQNFITFAQSLSIKRLTVEEIQIDNERMLSIKTYQDLIQFSKTANGKSFQLCVWVIENQNALNYLPVHFTEKHHLVCLYFKKVFSCLQTVIDAKWNLITCTKAIHKYIHAIRYAEYDFPQDQLSLFSGKRVSAMLKESSGNLDQFQSILASYFIKNKLNKAINSFNPNMGHVLKNTLQNPMYWSNQQYNLELNFAANTIKSLPDLTYQLFKCLPFKVNWSEDYVYIQRLQTYLNGTFLNVHLAGWKLMNPNSTMQKTLTDRNFKKNQKPTRTNPIIANMLDNGGYVWYNTINRERLVVYPKQFSKINQLVLELVKLTPKNLFKPDFTPWDLDNKKTSYRKSIENNLRKVALQTRDISYGWKIFKGSPGKEITE